jgi:hypothetical protein
MKQIVAVRKILLAKTGKRVAPMPRMSDPAHFLIVLRAKLDSIERRHRWRRVFAFMRACASHLVIEGDEDDA